MENKSLQNFKDLIVWQKAADLAVKVYKVTEKFPNSELYGITNQIRRSAVSISSNIAEGFKRSHKKEKLQFYNVACGSAAELASQIEIIKRLNYAEEKILREVLDLLYEVERLLSSLMKSTRKRFSTNVLNIAFLLFSITYSLFFIYSPIVIGATGQAYLKTDYTSLAPASEFAVTVLVHSDEPFNAFDFKISYDLDLFEFLGSNNANSLTDIWQEDPALSDNSINFSGAILKPFSGQDGNIIVLNFKSIRAGVGEIFFKKASIYLADGKGTEIRLSSGPLKISIDPKYPLKKLAESGDDTSPTLQLEIFKNPIENNSLISFSAKDPESGIREAFMRSKTWFGWGEWRVAENPFLPPEGAWAVELKIINNSNKETTQTLYFKGEITKKIALITGGLLFIMFALSLLYNKRKPERGNF